MLQRKTSPASCFSVSLHEWVTVYFLCFSAEHTNCASVVPFNNNNEMLYILFAAIKSIYQIILFCLSDMKKNVQIFAVLKPQMFFNHLNYYLSSELNVFPVIYDSIQDRHEISPLLLIKVSF